MDNHINTLSNLCSLALLEAEAGHHLTDKEIPDVRADGYSISRFESEEDGVSSDAIIKHQHSMMPPTPSIQPMTQEGQDNDTISPLVLELAETRAQSAGVSEHITALISAMDCETAMDDETATDGETATDCETATNRETDEQWGVATSQTAPETYEPWGAALPGWDPETYRSMEVAMSRMNLETDEQTSVEVSGNDQDEERTCDVCYDIMSDSDSDSDFRTESDTEDNRAFPFTRRGCPVGMCSVNLCLCCASMTWFDQQRCPQCRRQYMFCVN